MSLARSKRSAKISSLLPAQKKQQNKTKKRGQNKRESCKKEVRAGGKIKVVNKTK